MSEHSPSKELVEKPHWVPDNALRRLIRECDNDQELKGLPAYVLKGICLDLLDRRTTHEPPAAPNREHLRSALGCFMVENDMNADNIAVVLCTYFEGHMDRPKPDPQTENGWGAWAEQNANRVLDEVTDQILMRLANRAPSPPPDVLQAHIDYHYSQEAAAESIGAVASERFHRKSAEYLESIKRGEPPGESPTKSPSTEKDGSAAVHEAASGGEVPPERTLMPDLAEAIKSGVPLVKQLRAGHETSGDLT